MSKRTPRIFVYKAKDGWRGRLKSSNGKIVTESGESYTRKPNADHFRRMQDALYDAELVTQ